MLLVILIQLMPIKLCEDKLVILGSVASPDNNTANGGGLLKGDTDKKFTWSTNNGVWTYEHIQLPTDKKIQFSDTNEYIVVMEQI